MALSGTEAEIVNCVARLRGATKNQIRKEIGFSLEYAGFLCQYLVRRGYLTFSSGRYSLAKGKMKALEEEPGIDKKLIKEITGEIARELSGELKKTIRGIKAPVHIREIKKEMEERPEEQIKIKTDFDFPVEDESLGLETNIGKIGPTSEKEKSDIGKSVDLFKKIQKKMKGRML